MRAISMVRKATKALVLRPGVVSARRDGDLLILLFHRDGVGEREIDLPIAMVERHMAELAVHHPVRSLDDALMKGRGGVV